MSTAPAERPRHIALYLPSLRGGGAERVMVMLANGFAARGHHVDLVLARADGPYLAEVAAGVRVVDLARNRVLASLLPLVRYLRRERPDAMLSALNHANIIAILARKLARLPLRLVVSEHSAPSGSLTGSRQAKIMRRLTQLFYPQADAIIGVSQGIVSEMYGMLHLPKEKLHCIYNPVDINRIQRLMVAPINHPWLAAARGTRDHPVILAAGRLTAAKDYPTLLRAMAQLCEQRPARLIILGQGEEELALKNLVQDLHLSEHVFFAGFQENPFAWMHAADVYVMSSAWEGLPGALIEALACGARVVSTDCRTGPAEILEDGKWGKLVPVGDYKALSESILEIMNEKDKYFVATNRAEQFDIAHSVRNCEEAIFPSHRA